MSIEEDVFRKCKADLAKMEAYGFRQEIVIYCFSKTILSNAFCADIAIAENGKVQGKVLDLSFDEEEYSLFRVTGIADVFANTEKEAYEAILFDIRDKCFTKLPFLFEHTNRIAAQIKEPNGDSSPF